MNPQKHSTSARRVVLQVLSAAIIVLALAPIGGAIPPGPDTTPPVITGALPRVVLWPPFGTMLPVGLNASANDDCDGAIDVVVRIYSDEANTANPFPPGPDAIGALGVPLRLRGERLVPGPAGNAGRCYVVSLSATDAAGNTGQLCLGSVCPIMPFGMGIMAAQAELAVGQALCAANGGVIPPAMGWTELIPSFTLPPPIKAAPDLYDCIGNCRLTVSAPGVLANDSTISPPLTITTAGAFASTNGGNVVLAADGSFTYDPPAGFTGGDTWTYGIMDAFGRVATGTVAITVAEMIWFLDNTAAAGGDGRQTTPFDSFSDYTTMATDSAGDVIHVDTGDGTTTDYDTGLTLLSNQELYGEGVSLAGSVSFPIPPGNTLPGAGTRPDITNTTGAAIITAGGNTIRGLDISAPAGTGIAASGAGLTVSEVLISGPGSDGMSFSSVSGTVDVDNVDVTSSTGSGFNLSSSTASFDFDSACSVTNAGGVDFRVNGGTCAVTYNGNLSQSTGGGLVSVIGGHGTGTIVFQTGTVGCTSGSGIRLGPCSNTNTFSNSMSLITSTDAIVLTTSTGTTNFNGLLVTSSGDGLRSSGGGTLNVTGVNGINATGGAAIDVSSAALGMTFGTLTSTSGSNGIRLSSTTGSFTVTGLTDINTPTGDGILVGTSPATDIDFSAIDIDGGGADGIDISGGVGDFDVTGQTTIDGTSGTGIRVATSASDTFSFADTDVGLTTACTSGVSLTSSPGATFTFTNLDITTSAGDALVCDNAGTLTIDGNPALNATGGAAIDITSTNGSTNFAAQYQFENIISTNSPTVGIRFDTVSSRIVLLDVDIDSNSTMIGQGIEFTDCTGLYKIVRRGHIVFTGTNNANGVLVDNSDDVTIEGDVTSAFDPIGIPDVFVGALEITGMGTGSSVQMLNGNTHGHHAVTCHDSNGLTVDRCYIHDIGDVGNTDGSLDAGVYIDETTGGTVNVTNNHFDDIIGANALHIGGDSDFFTGTNTFNFTDNRVIGDPRTTPVSTEAGVQADLDSSTAATFIGTFDDNSFEGVRIAVNCLVDLGVTNGNSGTGGGGRNDFSASDNVVQDIDLFGIGFDFGDDCESRVIIDRNTLDASVNFTSFDTVSEQAIEIELRHDSAGDTPILDAFVRMNVIRSTNSASRVWNGENIRVATASGVAAGTATVRSLIADNMIEDGGGDGAINVESEEANVVNAIIRNNTIDATGYTPGTDEGIIDADLVGSTDPCTLRVWFDDNTLTSVSAAEPGFHIEEVGASQLIEVVCEGVIDGNSACPVSGTLTADADIVELLGHNGNTVNGTSHPTAAANTLDAVEVHDVDVIASTGLPGPTVLASAKAKQRVGTYLADEVPARILLEVAKQRWLDAGISNNDASLLRSISLEIGDLPDTQLGKTWITHIVLDSTAAGHGWFIDRTPEKDEEFTGTLAKKDGAAHGCMDLLTVLMHEIGHVLGREHCACGKHLMSHKLAPGVRHNPVR